MTPLSCPAIIASISPSDELAERFEAIERDRVGEGKHEAYHAMPHYLKDFYGVA